MKILAFETSGLLGSVALLETADGKLVSTIERETPADQRTARSLLPTTHELLKENSWLPADVELVAVTTGPGSFTGLRIGVVAAKTLAYAVGAKLVGVHTLAAMAEAFKTREQRLWTSLDAQRQELFAAPFDPARSVVDQAEPSTDIMPIDDWIAQLRDGDQVAGPPLAKLRQLLPAGVVIADERLWNPSAAAVGRLGIALFNRGCAISPLELVPDYFRKSAAEEKADASRAQV
jgi:tRNA threonylcarbamoyladenosine biosynthesis protein TsaB